MFQQHIASFWPKIATFSFSGSCGRQTNVNHSKSMWMTAKPQVAFYSTNPWLMVVGSDSPRFVLYEDGSIIYTKMRDRNRAVDFYSVQLTAEEHQQFLSSLHMDDEFWDFSLSLLKYI